MGIVYNNKYEQIKHSEKEDNSLAQIYFSEAEELRYNKKFKEAIDKYLHSILINRNNYKTYIGLALAYKNLKEYNKAIKNLEKFIEKFFVLEKIFREQKNELSR